MYFCASKLEAFNDRGKNDYFASHDLEDVIAVVDGRVKLVQEIRVASNDVRSYLGKEMTRLYDTEEFLDALPGHLPPNAASQARVTTVLARPKEIASLL